MNKTKTDQARVNLCLGSNGCYSDSSMTKVQRTFKLWRGLNDEELKKIAHIHAIYGILAARLTAADQLFVEYDASRLTAKEVEGTLEENGIPLS